MLAPFVSSLIRMNDLATPSAEGVTQCVCDGRDGLSWADWIRSAAEQDVDVLAVEDLCEPDAACAAVGAAADGVVVLARMQADGIAPAIASLLGMGVGRWSLASTLRGAVTQRVVRILCDECKKRVRTLSRDLARVGLERKDVDFAVYSARGCGKCGGSGYLDRVTLSAVAAVDAPLADAIRRGSPAALSTAVSQAGEGELLEATLAKLRAGQTSLDQLPPAGVRP